MNPQTRFNPPFALLLALLLTLLFLTGCGKNNDSDRDNSDYDTGSSFRYGYFIDSAVEGLGYTYNGRTDTTNRDGRFKYSPGGTITFSIGTLELGTATGATTMTPLDLVPGAVDASNQIVNNMLVLIQILDEDGDLNNGIKINSQTAAIVSQHADEIDFDQSVIQQNGQGFPYSLTNLLSDLNKAGVFTDTYRGQRSFLPYFFSDGTKVARFAREHFENTLKERITTNTTYGQVRGFAPDESTYQWRGIPYAAPPIDDLRWKPPEPAATWSGVREAVAYGDQATQTELSASYGEGGVSEDCLYLNITAPRTATNLPVMVWLHGGFFSVLTSNTSNYNNPEGIPSRDVVLVTVNHRLGPFGYLAHQWLTDESKYGGSGNYGQMDLVKALEWVQNNIANFGGDPSKITIFGESGGGTKVLSLMTANESFVSRTEPPFAQAICQSGMAATSDRSIQPFASLSDAHDNGAAFVALLESNIGLTPGTIDIDSLRALSWRDIINNADYQDNFKDKAITYAPNVDGYYMDDTFAGVFDAGDQVHVPFIGGTTEGDGRFLTPGYTNLMSRIALTHQAPMYAYVFTHVPIGWRELAPETEVLAYHAIELSWLFNSPESFNVHYLLTLPQRTVDFCNPGDVNSYLPNPPTINATEFETVMDYMVTMWTNFTKTGDPSYTGGLLALPDKTWGTYSEDNPQYMEISTDIIMQPTLSDAVFPAYLPCD